jgi:hypothetical protein
MFNAKRREMDKIIWCDDHWHLVAAQEHSDVYIVTWLTER